MGQVLSDAESAILQSRLQAGDRGHRQRIRLLLPNDSAWLDISDRNISIAKDSSLEMPSDSCTITLENTDGAFNIEEGTSLYDYGRPGVVVSVEQWHGEVANAVQTFTGKVVSLDTDDNEGRAILHVADALYNVFQTEIKPIAPQDPDYIAAIMDMENYVYLNKRVDEVLTDLLVAKGGVDPGDIDLADSSFVFEKIIFSSGSVGQALAEVCDAAGLRMYADEFGVIRTRDIDDASVTSYWTVGPEAVVELSSALSEDGAFTDVKVVGLSEEGDEIIGYAEDLAFQADWGLARTTVIRDDKATTQAEAQFIAESTLKVVNHWKRRRVVGILGHPGIQKDDRLTVDQPKGNVNGDYRVLSIRSEQNADQGTYLSVLVLEPWPMTDPCTYPISMGGDQMIPYTVMRLSDGNSIMVWEDGFLNNCGWKIKDGCVWGTRVVAPGTTGLPAEGRWGDFVRSGNVLWTFHRLGGTNSPVRVFRFEYDPVTKTVTSSYADFQQTFSGNPKASDGLGLAYTSGRLHLLVGTSWSGSSDPDARYTLYAINSTTLAEDFRTTIALDFVGSTSRYRTARLESATGNIFYMVSANNFVDGAQGIRVRTITAAHGITVNDAPDPTDEISYAIPKWDGAHLFTLVKKANAMPLYGMTDAGALSVVVPDPDPVYGSYTSLGISYRGLIWRNRQNSDLLFHCTSVVSLGNYWFHYQRVNGVWSQRTDIYDPSEPYPAHYNIFPPDSTYETAANIARMTFNHAAYAPFYEKVETVP